MEVFPWRCSARQGSNNGWFVRYIYAILAWNAANYILERIYMKNLFIIGGTMGIGKSTVSQILKHKLPDSVFLDGDWCWDSSPFQVTAETKKMVLQNICAVLNNFLKCSAYKNVIFCWVMHEQSIIDAIVSCLDTADCRIISVSLTCSEQELVQRLQKDVAAGIRTPDVIERSIQRIPLYQKLNTIKINTSGKSAAEVAQEIAAITKQ